MGWRGVIGVVVVRGISCVSVCNGKGRPRRLLGRLRVVPFGGGCPVGCG
jgi:hypothetical protein